MIRDRTRCIYCGAMEWEMDKPHERDHFYPRSHGGKSSPGNIVTACHLCNNIKGAKRFETIEECRRWLVRKYWSSKKDTFIRHRAIAFGGKDPAGYDLAPMPDPPRSRPARNTLSVAASRARINRIRAIDTIAAESEWADQWRDRLSAPDKPQ